VPYITYRQRKPSGSPAVWMKNASKCALAYAVHLSSMDSFGFREDLFPAVRE
jgi:hypothetical protein